jgi:hypothetical protein
MSLYKCQEGLRTAHTLDTSGTREGKAPANYGVEHRATLHTFGKPVNDCGLPATRIPRVQRWLEPSTAAGIEAFAPVLELLDQG